MAGRGSDGKTGVLFSDTDLEARVHFDYSLREIHQLVTEALLALQANFSALCSGLCLHSIPPEGPLVRRTRVNEHTTAHDPQRHLHQKSLCGQGSDDAHVAFVVSHFIRNRIKGSVG